MIEIKGNPDLPIRNTLKVDPGHKFFAVKDSFGNEMFTVEPTGINSHTVYVDWEPLDSTLVRDLREIRDMILSLSHEGVTLRDLLELVKEIKEDGSK